MKPISTLFRLLGDETRLRIVHLLSHQDLCVCELVELMDESQPKISKHIAKIRALDLVTTKRNEQFIYYSLNKDNEWFSILQTILEDIAPKTPYTNDVQQLQNKTSFVCTR